MTLSQEKDLHLVYKNLGETPLERAERFRNDHPEFLNSKITYAGRLDPMAEGLLVLLTNDAVNTKENFLSLSKTYEVEVLWGVGTDTQDVLGLISKTSMKYPEVEKVRGYISESVGKFEQKYPAYSSKPINGKPLFSWAREGKISEVEIPSHGVEILSANFLERKTILKEKLLEEIYNKISKVKGDFRQAEILLKWQQFLESAPVDEFVIDKMKLEVSSGFYVRQFVSDMAEKLETVGTTFHIKRTKVGDFEL